MLAEEGGGLLWLRRKGPPAEPGEWTRGYVGMLVELEISPVPQVRRPKQVFSTQHGHGGNAGRLETVREIEPVLRRGPLGKESMEALPLFPPGLGVTPPLVLAPGGPAHDVAERQPLSVVLDGYDDPCVVARTGKAAVGRHAFDVVAGLGGNGGSGRGRY